MAPLSLQPTRKRAKIEFLDGIRGVACLIVVLHHFSLAVDCDILYDRKQNPWFKSWWMALATSGNWAVQLFFIISGRVLVDSFINSNNNNSETNKLVSSMFRRAFRLGLPVLAVLCLSALLNQGLGLLDIVQFNQTTRRFCSSPWTNQYLRPTNLSIKAILKDTVALFAVQTAPKFQAAVLWTLPIEFTQSFWVYALALIVSHINSNKWITLNLILIILFPFFDYSFLFFFGFYLAHAQRTRLFAFFTEKKAQFSVEWFFIKFLRISMALYALAIVADKMTRRDTAIWARKYSLSKSDKLPENHHEFFISALLLVTSLSISPGMQYFLSLRPFRFLGTISYSLYLVHAMILPIAQCAYIRLSDYGLSKQGRFFVAFLGTMLPISLLLAIPFHYLIDDPSVKLTSKVYRHFSQNDWSDIVKRWLSRPLNEYASLDEETALERLV